MKAIKYWVIPVSFVLFAISCNPIENDDLRKDFASATSITQEELDGAISVSQLPNQDGAVKGDQYILVKNSHPEIGGCWHVTKGDLDLRSGSDNDTIVCPSNGEWSVYYVGISGKQNVRSTPVTLNVTNVFDEWSNFLTGAKDKADKTAKKVWRFRECEGYVCHNGAYGFWRYYPPEKVKGNAWWGQTTLEKAGNQKMEFIFDNDVIRTYKKDGTLNKEGSYSFSHSVPAKGVKGELKLSIPIIGSEFNEVGRPKDGVYWLLTFNEKYMTIAVPNKYTGGAEWEDMVWVAFFEAVE